MATIVKASSDATQIWKLRVAQRFFLEKFDIPYPGRIPCQWFNTPFMLLRSNIRAWFELKARESVCRDSSDLPHFCL